MIMGESLHLLPPNMIRKETNQTDDDARECKYDVARQWQSDQREDCDDASYDDHTQPKQDVFPRQEMFALWKDIPIKQCSDHIE